MYALSVERVNMWDMIKIPKTTNKRVGRFLFGAGVWDSWGFGFDYCHYSKALTIEFIHWYAYVEYWTKEETKNYKERQDSLNE
jgi:hypothetical protein